MTEVINFNNYTNLFQDFNVNAQTYYEQYHSSYSILSSANTNRLTQKQTKALRVYKKLAPLIIINDINSSLPAKQRKFYQQKSLAYASVWSVGIKKLIKKFGKRFVTKKLPALIYKRLPRIIKKKISKKLFTKFFKDVVVYSAGRWAAKKLTRFLKKHHVPNWAIKACSFVVETVIWWYVS